MKSRNLLTKAKMLAELFLDVSTVLHEGLTLKLKQFVLMVFSLLF